MIATYRPLIRGLIAIFCPIPIPKKRHYLTRNSKIAFVRTVRHVIAAKSFCKKSERYYKKSQRLAECVSNMVVIEEVMPFTDTPSPSPAVAQPCSFSDTQHGATKMCIIHALWVRRRSIPMHRTTAENSMRIGGSCRLWRSEFGRRLLAMCIFAANLLWGDVSYAQCQPLPYACNCGGIVSCFPSGCPSGCVGGRSKGKCAGAQRCPVTHVLPPEAPRIELFPPDARYQEVVSQPEKYELRTLDFPNGVAKGETWCGDILIQPIEVPITEVFLRVENTPQDTIPQLQTCTPGWCGIGYFSSARRFEEGVSGYGRTFSVRFRNDHKQYGRQVHLVFAIEKKSGAPPLQTLKYVKTWNCQTE